MKFDQCSFKKKENDGRQIYELNIMINNNFEHHTHKTGTNFSF